MQKRSLEWDHLQTLAAVVRAGNKSAAARELGLTHATIGRRLRDLEAALGTALFARSEAGLELTATGRQALAAATAMEGAAGALARQLQAGDGELRGRVRVTCTEGFGTDLLPRHLPALHARHPGLELEILIDSRTLSLTRRRADLAIRLARPQEEALVTRRLAELPYALCCAPALADAAARALAAGAPLPLCRFEASLGELPESRWLDEHLPQGRPVLLSNNALTLLQACAAGAGVALLPVYLARRHGLALLETPAAPRRSAWLAYPEEYREVPRFRAVADWLIATFAAERAALAGAAGP